MQVLAVLEGNLVVVEPRLETVLRHANVDFCITGCCSDSGLGYNVVGKARAIERAKFFLQLHCLSDAELVPTFPRIFAFWLLTILAMLFMQL